MSPQFETKEKYRPNVCAVVLHPTDDNKVLFCHRVRFDSSNGWQFPQGGINPTLDLVDEMRRELREEIGTDNVEVIKFSENYYSYDFPGKPFRRRGGFVGQRQRWILCRYLGTDEEIDVNTIKPEFDSWEWTAPMEAVKWVVDFKQEIYHAALQDLGVL